METLSSSKSGSTGLSSQANIVDVQEIRDDVIALKSGSLRAVLSASSINFDLKSTEEQEAVIYQYQSFLNSLDFPLQIVVNSRKFNIKPYLHLLEEKEKKHTNELLRIQTAEYRAFIQSMTEVSNIMTKNFYVIVPFHPVESDQKGGLFSRIAMSKKQSIVQGRQAFETYKNQLWQRVDYVIAGIRATGVSVNHLKTPELIELMYNFYNPGLFANKDIEGVDKLEFKG